MVVRPRDPALFADDQRRGLGLNGAEAQFAIEPEGAGIDGLRVLQADLIRIDGEAIDAEHLVEQVEQACVEPGGFAFAERVVQVEAHFGAFEQGEQLHVTGGDAVLEEHAGVVGPERQAPCGRNAEEEYLDAAAEIRAIDGSLVGVAEAVKLPIAHGGRVEDEIEHAARFRRRETAKCQRRAFELPNEGDIAAADERFVVYEELPSGQAQARPRNG